MGQFNFFNHDPSNHSRMRFQHALIQSHIHALLLTLRKVAMSIKYNTKWPFDLITCRVRCTIIMQWSGNDIPVNLFCSCIFTFYKSLNECFRDEKYGAHRFISYLQ